MADIKVSGTTDPYNYQSYTVESNDKNTLSMTDYFKLMAAQLQNQDVTNPMETSEMMQQMVQMGMMQAMSSMTDSMSVNTATTAQTYAGSLLGQEVTVMTTEEKGGVDVPNGVKYGKVEWVSFVDGNPTFKLEGDSKEYGMSYLVGVGQVPDPFKERKDGSGVDLDGSDDDVEGTEETGGTTENPGGTGTVEGGTDEDSEGAGTVAGSEEPATETASAGAAESADASTEPTEGAEEGAAAAAGVTEEP